MSNSKDKPERKSIISSHPLAGTHLGGQADVADIFGAVSSSSPTELTRTGNTQKTAEPLPGGRDRQEIPFHLRHRTDNIQVDRRLLPAYQQLLRRKGRNKTDALNHIILEACLREGIAVDPGLLDRPFSFDDVADEFR